MKVNLKNKAIQLDYLETVLNAIRDGYKSALGEAEKNSDAEVNEGARIIVDSINQALDSIMELALKYSQKIDTKESKQTVRKF